MAAHQHRPETYIVNGKLVCRRCHDEKGGNECFCTCHQGQDPSLVGCSKCQRFHNN